MKINVYTTGQTFETNSTMEHVDKLRQVLKSSEDGLISLVVKTSIGDVRIDLKTEAIIGVGYVEAG